MRTAAIDRQLAAEHAQLAEAQGEAAKAAELLAQDPSNPKHRVAVVEAQQIAAEIQVGIDALDAARKAAAEFDASEEGKALRKARADTVAGVNAAQANLVKAASAVDKSLADLLASMNALGQACQAAHAHAVAYLDLNETGIETRMHHYEQLNRMPRTLAHALMLNLYEALKASGLDYQGFITVNMNEVTPPAGEGVKFERSMGAAAQVNAERIAKSLDHIEQIHTGCYVPPSAIQVQAAPIQDSDHYVAKDFGDLMAHMGKNPEQRKDDAHVQASTLAKDWPEYVNATARLECPVVLTER